MFPIRTALVCLAALAALTGVAPAQSDAAARQYYTTWNFQPAGKYYYRTYYYKPTEDFAGYHHHYVVHYPDQPQYLYFYNPQKKLYWGRFDCHGKLGAQYSFLQEKDRKSKVADIPQTAFPKPGKMPPIPDSTDGATIQPPPADLPPAEKQP